MSKFKPGDRVKYFNFTHEDGKHIYSAQVTIDGMVHLSNGDECTILAVSLWNGAYRLVSDNGYHFSIQPEVSHFIHAIPKMSKLMKSFLGEKG